MKTQPKKNRTSVLMRRLLRILLWLFLFFISLFVIAILSFKIFYPQDQIQILLTEKLTQITGRDFSMGKLSFRFPGRLDIEDFRLGFDPSENMGDSSFVKFKQLSIQFRFFSLLGRKIVIKEISIESPQIHLRTSSSVETDNSQTGKALQSQTADQALKPLPLSLGLFNLDLNNFQFKISFPDPAQDRTLLIKGLNLELSGLSVPRSYNRSLKDLTGVIRLFTEDSRAIYRQGNNVTYFDPRMAITLQKKKDGTWFIDSEIGISRADQPDEDEIVLSVQANGVGQTERVKLENIGLSVNQKNVIRIEGEWQQSDEKLEYHASLDGNILNLNHLKQFFRRFLPEFIWNQIPSAELSGSLQILNGTVRGNREKMQFQTRSKLEALNISVPYRNIYLEDCDAVVILSGTANQDGFEGGDVTIHIGTRNLRAGIGDTTVLESGPFTILLQSALGNRFDPVHGKLRCDFTDLLQGQLTVDADWNQPNDSQTEENRFNIKGRVTGDSLAVSDLPTGDLEARGVLNLVLDMSTTEFRRFAVSANCETPGIRYLLNGQRETTPAIQLRSDLYAGADPEFHVISVDSGLIEADGLVNTVFSGQYDLSKKTFSFLLDELQLDNQRIPDFLPGIVKTRLPGLALRGDELLTMNLQGVISENEPSIDVTGCLSLHSLGMSVPGRGIQIDQIDGSFMFEGNLDAVEGSVAVHAGEFNFREMSREPYRDGDLRFKWYFSPGDSISISDGKLDAQTLGLSSFFMMDLGDITNTPNLRTRADIRFFSEDSIFLIQDLQLLGKLGFHLSGITIGRMEMDHFSLVKGKDFFIQNACGFIPVDLKIDPENQKIILDPLFRPLTWVEYENQRQLYQTQSEFVKQLCIDTVQFAGYQLKDVIIDMGISEGYIQIPSFNVKLFDGNLGGSVLLDLGSLEKQTIAYAIQAQASRINSAALAGIQTAREEETELNMTMSFKGKGVDLERGIDLEGYFYITKMGPKFASTLLEGMDPGGSDRSIRMTRRLLNTGWKPRLFSFDLRHGYVYPSLMLNQPWFSPIRIPGKLEYGRLPLAFFLKNLQSPAE